MVAINRQFVLDRLKSVGGQPGSSPHNHDERYVRLDTTSSGLYVPRSAFLGKGYILIGDGASSYSARGPGADGEVPVYLSSDSAGLSTSQRLFTGSYGGWFAASTRYKGALYRATDVGDNGLLLYCDGTTWQPVLPQCIGTLGSAGQTRTNNANEATLYVCSVPANFFTVNSVLRIKLTVGIDHPATAEAWNFRMIAGTGDTTGAPSTFVYSGAAFNAASDATARTSRVAVIEWLATFQSTTVLNIIAHGMHDNDGSIGVDTAGYTAANAGNGLTVPNITTTAFTNLGVTVQMAAASASRVVHAKTCTVEVLKL
jgi:hypothetical protein